MHLHVTEPVKNVQDADDTFFFAANENIKVGNIQLESVIENILIFFENHHLNLNVTKTKFIIFSKKSKIQEKNIGATAIARRLRADDLFEASNYSARKIRFQLV